MEEENKAAKVSELIADIKLYDEKVNCKIYIQSELNNSIYISAPDCGSCRVQEKGPRPRQTLPVLCCENYWRD